MSFSWDFLLLIEFLGPSQVTSGCAASFTVSLMTRCVAKRRAQLNSTPDTLSQRLMAKKKKGKICKNIHLGRIRARWWSWRNGNLGSGGLGSGDPGNASSDELRRIRRRLFKRSKLALLCRTEYTESKHAELKLHQETFFQ